MLLKSREISTENNILSRLSISWGSLTKDGTQKHRGEAQCGKVKQYCLFPPHTRPFSSLFHSAVFCAMLQLIGLIWVRLCSFYILLGLSVSSFPKTRLITEPTQLTEYLEKANNIRSSKYITGYHIAFCYIGPNKLQVPFTLLSGWRDTIIP